MPWTPPHDGHIRRIQIENERIRTKGNEALMIAAEGYSPLGRCAQTIAAERHLLETVLRRPMVVKPMKTQTLNHGRQGDSRCKMLRGFMPAKLRKIMLCGRSPSDYLCSGYA